jgi:hypothetical protein
MLGLTLEFCKNPGSFYGTASSRFGTPTTARANHVFGQPAL